MPQRRLVGLVLLVLCGTAITVVLYVQAAEARASAKARFPPPAQALPDAVQRIPTEPGTPPAVLELGEDAKHPADESRPG